VTVKCRLGVDDDHDFDRFLAFIDTVAAAGCRMFVVHARNAWLKGLSPKQNREIPPLNYPWVYRLKADLPQLTIVLNGGITTLDECRQHLAQVDGIMLGRVAYHDPWLLADVDRALFGTDNPLASRHAVIDEMLPYVARELAAGAQLNHITRHLLGLYQGLPGARQFRRHISENAHRKGAGIEVLEQAYRLVRDAGERQQARNSAA